MAATLQVSADVNDVSNARKRCADLLRRATGPMHVPQPDGSTLRLCYLGRIMRAQALIDTVAPETRPAVLTRYWQIVDEANAAWADYVAARDAYLSICAWAGVAPDEPQERDCACAVCSQYQSPTVHLGDSVDDTGAVDNMGMTHEAAWVVEANQAQAALDAIPWDALRDPDFFDNSATIGTWLREHGPKEQQP